MKVTYTNYSYSDLFENQWHLSLEFRGYNRGMAQMMHPIMHWRYQQCWRRRNNGSKMKVTSQKRWWLIGYLRKRRSKGGPYPCRTSRGSVDSILLMRKPGNWKNIYISWPRSHNKSGAKLVLNLYSYDPYLLICLLFKCPSFFFKFYLNSS